jgi:hypothetical protein
LEQEYRTDILAETVFPETKPGFQVRICFWPMKFAIKMGVVPGFSFLETKVKNLVSRHNFPSREPKNSPISNYYNSHSVSGRVWVDAPKARKFTSDYLKPAAKFRVPILRLEGGG